MSTPQDYKCVIVLADDLLPGQLANGAAVLALTLGKKVEKIVGPDINDASSETHLGLVHIPIPVLKASRADLLHVRIEGSRDEEMTVVDFSESAQIARTYEDYTQRIQQKRTEDIVYLGIALYGKKKSVSSLTGKFGLVR